MGFPSILKYREKAGEDTIQVTEVCFEKEEGGRDIEVLSRALGVVFWRGGRDRAPIDICSAVFWSHHHHKEIVFWRTPEGCNIRKKQADSIKKAFIRTLPS